METYANELLIRGFRFVLNKILKTIPREVSAEATTEDVLIHIISELTYSNRVTGKTTLSETGLSSMTTIVLVGELKKNFSGLRLSVRDCSGSVTISDLAQLISERVNQSKVHPWSREEV